MSSEENERPDLPPTEPGNGEFGGATIPDTPSEAGDSPPQESGQANFGRYALLERVGVGGMGEVWSAYDPELGRRVAIKILKPNLGAPTAPQRLIREAQAMAQLNHPNVATVHDVGTAEGKTYITMEFVEGRTLDQWLQSCDPSWRECVKVFVQAGKGLAAAHRAELVHRDFKPSNVMIDGSDHVRVMDFGLARLEVEPKERERPTQTQPESTPDGESSSSESALAIPLTVDGTIVGTPAYMAPEQLAGLAADSRTDQFAFCIALYEALFRIHPFGSGDQKQRAYRAASGAVLPPPKATRVPPRIMRTVLRGLNPMPEQRFECMEELLKELTYDPAQIRRRVLVATLATATVASLVLAGFLLMERSTRGIARAEKRLAETWNAEARLGIVSAFEGTGLAFAPDAAEQVTASLDAYAKSWVSAARTVHSRSEGGAELSEAMADRQVACLDQRLNEFAHLVRLLGEDDSEIASKADEAAGGLRDPDACTDTTRFSSEIPLPVDPEVRRSIEDQSNLLAQVYAYRLVGEYSTAHELANSVVSAVRAIDYPPLLADALVHRGHLEIELGMSEDALQTLEESFFESERGGSDGRALEAATELIWHFSILDPNPDEAERWWEIGRAKLSRAGDRRDLEIPLLAARAAALERGGQYDEALELQQRVFDLTVEHEGEDNSEAASAHHQLANTLLSTGQYDAALEHYERAATLKEKHMGVAHPSLATTLVSMGSTLGYLKRYEDSLEVLRRALGIGEAALGDENPNHATTLNNMAYAFEALERYDEALASHERALALTRSSWGGDHPQVAYSLLNRASLRRKAEQYELGIQDAEEAGRILSTAFGEEHPLYAYAANARGMMLFYSGRPAESVPELERALRIRLNVSTDAVLLAGTRHNLARCLWDADVDRERALELAYTARAELSDAGERGLEDLRLVDEWLAERTVQEQPGEEPEPTPTTEPSEG